MLASTFSTYAPSAHHIQAHGLGYRGVLSTEQLQRAVPAAFADAAHESRSARYAALRAAGTDPAIVSITNRTRSPDTRTTATPARPAPEDSATIVG